MKELNLNQILFADGDKAYYHAYLDADNRFLICHENIDDGNIDFTIYTHGGIDVDGGCFDYPDDWSFVGYTLKELLEFAEFKATKEIPNADELAELIDEIDNLRFKLMTDFTFKM